MEDLFEVSVTNFQSERNFLRQTCTQCKIFITINLTGIYGRIFLPNTSKTYDFQAAAVCCECTQLWETEFFK